MNFKKILLTFAVFFSTFIFSTSINGEASTINKDIMYENIYFTYATIKKINASVTVSGKELKISPTADLDQGKSYTLQITNNVKNTSRQSIKTPKIPSTIYTHTLSGVVFNTKNTPYYTINFYRPYIKTAIGQSSVEFLDCPLQFFIA